MDKGNQAKIQNFNLNCYCDKLITYINIIIKQLWSYFL